MPIEVEAGICGFEQEQFHAWDRRVMGIVFEVHNDFGRLLEEELYKREIAARCVETGMGPVEREVRVRVRHEGFAKDYYMDVLVGGGFMLEAKAVERLSPAHRGQALNYLMLAGLTHGRLVNLRSERVEHEFVSTTLTLGERRRFEVVERGWMEAGAESARLKGVMIELVKDWGGFLDVGLYREALVHFLGGAEAVCRPVGVFSGERLLGTQSLNLLNEETAFAVTTVTDESGAMRRHLERLVRHTRLTAIQWVNLNRHTLELTTIQK